MTAHTPGPWIATGTPDDPGGYTQWHIRGTQSRNDPVCTVFYTDETGRANARLIAEAPEMLAALRDAMAIARDATPANLRQMHARMEIIAINCAAAIAKATREDV